LIGNRGGSSGVDLRITASSLVLPGTQEQERLELDGAVRDSFANQRQIALPQGEASVSVSVDRKLRELSAGHAHRLRELRDRLSADDDDAAGDGIERALAQFIGTF
jgi:hypothetical protein